MSNKAYVGALAPTALVLTVTPGPDNVDLSTVTAATLAIRRADGSSATWTCAMSAQSTTSLTLTHPYVVGDLNMPGLWSAGATLTVPSGTIRTEPEPFPVYPWP